MRFIKLAEVFEELETTSSGNKIREILSKLFKKSSKQELGVICYLILGNIDSEYKGTVLGLANKMAARAVAAVAKKDVSIINKEFKKKGDLGLVAEQIVKGKGKLEVKQAVDILKKISETSGKGSQEEKLRLLITLLRKSTPKEAKYLIRIALGKLRLGVGAMAILDGLSLAFTGDKSSRKKLEEAYNLSNDIGDVAEKFSKGKLRKISSAIGIPIKMMLAQRVKEISEIRKKLKGPIVAEEKYDGERVQIHRDNDKIMFFSRRLENITKQYPDVLKAVKKAIKKKKYIIEGEIVTVDSKGRLRPFQELMQRRRKFKIEEYVKKVPVKLYLFDLLLSGDKNFISEPYLKRRKELEKIVRKNKIIELAKQVTVNDVKKMDEFFKKSLARNCEGIIAKSTDSNSVYRAGAREWLWIKWKKEYVKGMMDTFDLVIVGAYAGRGKRRGKYGALLLAVKDKSKYLTVTKVGTGFTDKDLVEIPKRLKKSLVNSCPKNVIITKAMKPDYYFKPSLVIEISGGEITKSPSHSSEYAVRFPRFLRYRDDKSARQATSLKEVKGMYKGK